VFGSTVVFVLVYVSRPETGVTHFTLCVALPGEVSRQVRAGPPAPRTRRPGPTAAGIFSMGSPFASSSTSLSDLRGV